MDNFIKNDEPVFQSIINGISLSFSVIVVLILIAIGYVYPKLADRVTFRIQGFIAFLDIVRHTNIIFYTIPNSPLCLISGFFGIFGDTLYILLNVAIALNIHLIAIKNIIPSAKFQIWLILGAIGIAFFLNLGAFFFDVIGPSARGVCYIKTNLAHLRIVNFFLLYLPNIPGTIYCAFVSVKVISKFNEKKIYEQNGTLIEADSPRMPYIATIKFVRKLYLRVALLPLFCVISVFFYLISCLRKELGYKEKDMLILLSRFGLRLAGTLNFIALVLDPYFLLAFKRLFLRRGEDELPYDIESGYNQEVPYPHDNDYQKEIAEPYIGMNFDEDDLKILEQRKYIKLA